MADRYWVGGSGTWDATTTTHWSATSGGAGGASAPTSADNVIFNSASSASGYTITVGTNAVCADITVSAPASGVAAFSLAATSVLGVYGSMLLNTSSSTWTGASGAVVAFKATTTGKTVTTNGISLISSGGNNSLNFDGVGGGWALGSALTTTTPNLINGSLDTGGFNVTCSTNFIVANSASIKSLTLGASTITVGGSVNMLNTTNLTLNAGTSTFLMTNSNTGFTIGGVPVTFNNLTFSSAGSGIRAISGANTFNNVTFTSISATGIINIRIDANQTINGTLTLGAANTAIRRMFMFSDVVGTPRTITAAAIATLADVDFRDIVAAGASGTWAGTRLGNCLGNGNITFAAGKTVYWNLAGSQNWSATGWATTNNGTPAVNNFPLAQDTATFTEAGAAGTVTVDAAWNIGTLTYADGISNRVTAATLATGATAPSIYGNLKLFSNLTLSGTGAISFTGGGVTRQITSAGKTFTQPLTVNNATGTLQLADALTTSAGFSLTSGTLALNGFDLTALTFSSSNSNVRSIAFGANKIVVTGSNQTIIVLTTLTGFTYTGSPLFDCNYSGSTGTRIISSSTGVTESNAVNIKISAGTDTVNTSSGHFYRAIDFTGFAGSLVNTQRTLYGNLTVSSGMTLTAGANATIFAATSGTQAATTNDKTLDFPVTKQGAGVLQLQDALTIGSTRTFTHTAGSVDLNSKTLTVGAYSTTGAVARSIAFGAGGSIVDLGTWTASGSNFTTSGTGSISMTSASAKNFDGGGFSYPTLNQGGAGDLTITGANRFKDMTNTVQPCVVKFPASTDTNVENFSMSGTPGNLVSLRSSTSGQKFNLVKV